MAVRHVADAQATPIPTPDLCSEADDSRSDRVQARNTGAPVTDLLGHDGEREAVFGVVHQLPDPLLGVAVA